MPFWPLRCQTWPCHDKEGISCTYPLATRLCPLIPNLHHRPITFSSLSSTHLPVLTIPHALAASDCLGPVGQHRLIERLIGAGQLLPTVHERTAFTPGRNLLHSALRHQGNPGPSMSRKYTLHMLSPVMMRACTHTHAHTH